MIIHQFSHLRDSKKSQLSVESIRRLYPEAPIYLWSDAKSPVDPALDYSGAIVRQTTFRRGGNLTGVDCLLGMRECYAVGYDENPNETHHIKFDPDSLLLRRDGLDRYVKNDVYFMGSVRAKAVGGWFQMHSREFLNDYLRAGDVRKFANRTVHAEDWAFWHAALKLADGRTVKSIHDEDFGACCYHRFYRPVSGLAAMTAVNFGTRSLATQFMVAEAMRSLLNYIELPA